MLREPFVVIGGSGMLGRAVCDWLAREGRAHHVPAHANLDLRDERSISAGIPMGTGTVINCAGWTNVDGAESNEQEATHLNGTAVGQLAAHCKNVGAVLVHYSTDYVFAGQGTEPYPIDHPRAPLNAYGRSKAVGEVLLAQSGAEHLLLRTSWVYAPWGKNFVRTIIGLAKQRSTLKVVNDQLGRPSSAEQIARVTLELLRGGGRGVYHVSDRGQCTWFEFAAEAIALAGLDCRVEPCTSAEFPSPAVRPGYSVLDLSRTEAKVGLLTPWQTSLADVVRRLETGPQSTSGAGR